MANAIPEIINAFNVYGRNGRAFLGISGAVTLPNMDAITETISGAGVLGEYETSVPGQFGSITLEVPFRILDSDAFSIMNMNSNVDLTFRASEQSTVKSTGALQYSGMRVVVRGRFKSLNAGSLEQGKQMNASITLEVLYYMVEISGRKVLELDKLNSIFKVNGTNMLASVNRYS